MTNGNTIPKFIDVIQYHGASCTTTGMVSTIQMNITKLCNQACNHCHVGASPIRTEMMEKSTMQRCLEVIQESDTVTTVDITGGAPELHPEFQWFIQHLFQLKKKIIVRHNLTVTIDPHPKTGESLRYLPEFFRDHRIELISSLPSFDTYFTNKQRGLGVFEKSIQSLQLLNEQGFGKSDTGLLLHLVYNPVGFYLPGNEQCLGVEFKEKLWNNFQVQFNQIYTITNMPINRFKESLIRKKNLNEYMNKLVSAFNPDVLPGLMCRTMISIGYDGLVYDCDFNQMENLHCLDNNQKPISVFSPTFSVTRSRDIIFEQHCFGCTAGNGSSCGGSIA